MAKRVVFLITIFICGGIAGWFLHRMPKPGTFTSVREDPADYKFIDPVLFLQVPEDTTTPQFDSLRSQITSYISTADAQHKASDVSVYFRELNKDRWVGVNADDKYAPASMLKVVSMIAFLRKVQDNPSLLNQSLVVSTTSDISQDFYPPAHPVQAGQSYPAQELVDDMIVDSDNNSAATIDAFVGKSAESDVYNQLQLPDPDQNDAGTIDNYSPKIFSRLFRSLYNGAYLSDDISNQALELMTKTTFTKGLVAGVPEGTVVAHKFGERTILPAAGSTASTIRELHDCGIVYAPHDPYLLCIMSKGNDFPTLQNIISDISAITWKSVQALGQGTAK